MKIINVIIKNINKYIKNIKKLLDNIKIMVYNDNRLTNREVEKGEKNK